MLASTAEEALETLYKEPTEFMDKMNDPMALLAVIGNTMYLHQSMKQPNRAQFLKAMIKEIETQQKENIGGYPYRTSTSRYSNFGINMGHEKEEKMGTGLVSKYKARLNANGRQQKYGVNYWETFAPVVAWTTITLIVTLSIIHKWHT